MKTLTVLAALLPALAFAAPAVAGDAPAVSAPNVKADLSAGALSGGPAVVAGATATVPMGHDFGFQMDAAFGNADRDNRGGLAGHAFYRDPESMLLGVTGMWSKLNGPHEDAETVIYRYGVESEFYLGNFSVLPSAGVQNSHGDSTGYATVGGIYYATPNVALASSVGGASNIRYVQLGSEFRLQDDSNISYLVDTGMSNQGPGYVMVGVRFSFGAPSRSIQERDRYDDPGNIVTYMNTTASNVITAPSVHNSTPAPAPVVAPAPAPAPPPI